MRRAFLSPAGAVLALICFFMPWVKFSCGGVERSSSGADIGGALWLVPLAAGVVLVAFFVFRGQKRAHRAKPFVIGSALVALATMLVRYQNFMSEMKTQLGISRPEDIGLKIEFGAIGTVIGFALALIGAFTLSEEGTSIPSASEPRASGTEFCTKCGQRLDPEHGSCSSCGAKKADGISGERTPEIK